VDGLVGEQFALPEAVEALRAVCRKPDETETVIVSSADPVNLVGFLLPDSRLNPFSDKVIAYLAGDPVADLSAVLSQLQGIRSATGLGTGNNPGYPGSERGSRRRS